MSRPTEPHSASEDPERWADIAAWEQDRADRLQAELDEANERNERLSDALDRLINAAEEAEATLTSAVRDAGKAR